MFQTVRVKEEPTDRTDQPATRPLPALPVLPPPPPPPPGPESAAADRGADSRQDEDYKPPCKKSAMDDLFGDVFITKVQEPTRLTPLAVIQHEEAMYQEEPCIPPTCNPLDWWKVNNYRFPNLAVLAKAYLGVPGTSVPSERVFSTAGDIVNAQRAGLSSKNVDMLVFLKKNLKIDQV
jgi:hypothetical protein